MEHITSENILLIGSILLAAGVFIGKSSYRIGLPLLLVFLLVGMGFGSGGLGIQFSNMHTAQFIGMIALCIILFSGGMGTRISAIRPVLISGLLLSTIGVMLTALLTGLFIWWLSGMEWSNIHFALLPSFLLAATMSSTDSASVFGILRSQKVELKYNLQQTLELESGSNDPMAYMLTIILIEAITLDSSLSFSHLITQLILQFSIGGFMGWCMGKFTIVLLRTYRNLGVKNGSKEDSGQMNAMSSIITIAAVFFTFGATTDMNGNGYLAVYLCGIVIGNSNLVGLRGVGKFMDSLTWLAQIVVFLMLGLLVNPHELLDVAIVSILIALFMILIGRPLSVFISMSPLRKASLKSKIFISWVGLRGAVPIIFATYPVVANIEGANAIFNIVFFVTLLSLLVQGTTIISSAKALNLIDNNAAPETDFGVELSEELPTSLDVLQLTEFHLANGNTLRDMKLPEGTLVMMIRRGNSYIVPNGSRNLYAGDILLLIRETKE